MISVPFGTGDIPCGYDICCADDIRFAHEGTDIISYLHRKYIIRQKPYIISRQRYIIEKHNFMTIISSKNKNLVR